MNQPRPLRSEQQMDFPNWRHPLAVPTVGDDVVVKHLISFSSEQSSGGIQISVQPKSIDGQRSELGEALAVLMTRLHFDTSVFLDKHFNLAEDKKHFDNLRVDLKNILENYRSALDYVAHHLAGYCDDRQEEKIFFPIAHENDDAHSFAKRLSKWFPGLGSRFPAVIAYLISIQGFKGNFWLPQFRNITNISKHRMLPLNELAVFESTLIKCGLMGLRLGELGLNSMRVTASGTLRFCMTPEKFTDLTGPLYLHPEMTSSPNFPHVIKIIKERRRLLRIPGLKHSIPHTVWTVSRGVMRTVSDLCELLSARAHEET